MTLPRLSPEEQRRNWPGGYVLGVMYPGKWAGSGIPAPEVAEMVFMRELIRSVDSEVFPEEPGELTLRMVLPHYGYIAIEYMGKSNGVLVGQTPV